MAQYCPHCKWYSADGLTHCTTCGAQFDLEDWDEEAEAELEEERPLFERVGWALALIAGALVGGTFLYNRFVTPSKVQAAGAIFDRLAETVKGVSRSIESVLLGPNGEYTDFAVIILLTSAFVWVVLWIMARLRR